MKKYEARIYLGKEMYQALYRLVELGVFGSVNQAVGEMVKSEYFKNQVNLISEELSKFKEAFDNGKQ